MPSRTTVPQALLGPETSLNKYRAPSGAHTTHGGWSPAGHWDGLYKVHALGVPGARRLGDLGLLQGCLPEPVTFEVDFEE